jgi:hypothetical protein
MKPEHAHRMHTHTHMLTVILLVAAVQRNGESIAGNTV